MGIVPSMWPEPFGIVIIEAMSSGRPVIASRVGGIPDIIRDGEVGLLVSPGDPVELRQAIERVLSDPVLREKMGREAKQQAAAYQADAVVGYIEKIYARLIKSQSEAHEQATPGEHYYKQL
jgi:glycosyltransferase involved in cell wall biosynthesis